MSLNPDGTKTCPRCGDSKPAGGNFYKSGTSSDGYAGYCIPCTKEVAVKWQQALPEDRRHAKNRADWQRTKRTMTPEKRRRRAESVKLWINASPKNKAKQRAWQLAYKRRDPERRRQANQIHNNHARAKRLGVPSAFQYIDWLTTLEHYRHRCAFCGASGALLDMEHLDALGIGGHNIPGNVVPACRPCNAQKWRKTLTQFCAERGLNEKVIRARALAFRKAG